MSFESTLGRRPAQGSLEAAPKVVHAGNWKENSHYTEEERALLRENPQRHHDFLLGAASEASLSEPADAGDVDASGILNRRSKTRRMVGAREMEQEAEFLRTARKHESRVAPEEMSATRTVDTDAHGTVVHAVAGVRDADGKLPRGKKTFDAQNRHCFRRRDHHLLRSRQAVGTPPRHDGRGDDGRVAGLLGAD
jgi:hypothetical protein